LNHSDLEQEPAIIQSAAVSAGSPHSEVSGFRRGAVDVFALLGYYVQIVGSLLPTLSVHLIKWRWRWYCMPKRR